MDFLPQLASLQSFVSRADLAICHEEVPFAPPEGPFQNYPMFAAPPAVAEAIGEVGWDACTTASNHTMDAGWEGLVRTVETLEAAGVRAIGTHPTEEHANTPTIVETEAGVRVGYVSQTYGLNGLPKAKGKDWSVQLIDAERAVEEARRAKAAGPDIVAVHLHAGDEYQHEPNEQQRHFAEVVTASEDVDVVFGQHAHVVQPIDKVNGKWVLYGSGNLIAQSGPAQPYAYDGYVAEIEFREQADGTWTSDRVVWAPTAITHHRSSSPARVLLIPDALAAGEGDPDALKASAERTRKVVTSRVDEGLEELGAG